MGVLVQTKQIFGMQQYGGRQAGADSYTHVDYRRNPNAGVGGCCNQICGSLMSE